MALRVLYPYTTESTLTYAIKRLSDGLHFDFSDGTFKPDPETPTAPLPEGTPTWVGLYMVTLDPTPVAEFPDGGYAVMIVEGGVTIDVLGDAMTDGDDEPVFPSGAGMDPWSAMPGGYSPGSFGALLGTNLDARVSSRSVYAGGPVASVAAAVTLDMAQAVPMMKTQTLGGALNGSLAATFGRSVKDRVNKVLQLFGVGQAEPLVTFDLDDVSRPSTRTPRP